MRLPRFKGLIAGFCWIALCGAALPADDPEAFTRAMAERIAREVPQLSIETAAPLQLRVTGAPGQSELTINLDRSYNVCRQDDEAACEASIANFVGSIRELASLEGPFTREQLRLMVRGSDYCEVARREFEQAARPTELVMRPAGPGLCALLVVDYPNSMRLAARGEVTALSLTPDAAWALAAQQTARALGAMPELDELGETLIVVTGRDYIPSLLLDHERWRRLASTHGEIVVAVPADGVLVAIKRSLIPDLAEFRAVVGEDFSQAERGISPRLYRWAGSGWEEIR